MERKGLSAQVLDFSEKIDGFDFDLLAPTPKRGRGRPPGSRDRKPRKRELIGLRARLEALIEKSLDYQLDKGVPFVEAVAQAMQAKPLEALKVFAAYLPQQVHHDVRHVTELHLAAVRQLGVIDATVQQTDMPELTEQNQ